MGFLTDEVLGLGYIHEKRFSTVQWLSIAHAANCKCLFAKETSVTFINYKLRNMTKKFSSYKKRVVYLMLDNTKL